MEQTEVQSGWLTVPVEEKQNNHILARTVVQLPPGQWELCLCAHDHYKLWLDGIYAGQGSVPSYREEERFDSYAVEGGKTVTIAVHLYTQGLENRVFCSDGQPGLWASLRQGAQERDFSWQYCLCKAYSGGTIGYETQFLENFDSRLWPEGWEQPGFDDSGWSQMLPLKDVPCPVKVRPVKPLQEQWIGPRSAWDLPGGVLLDFGEELVGTLYLKARGEADSQIILRFGEELDENNRVRYEMRCNCGYEEVWTLTGGTDTLHQYDYKAFRYAEILYPHTAKVLDWAVNTRCYPLDESRCTLSCPTDQLEDIFRICKNAVRWCTQEGYLDCPSREKGQYLGDAMITAHSQVLLTGSTEMLRKCIRDFIASGRRSSTLMGVAPCTLEQEIGDFSLLFPMLPLMDYAFTRDKAFLAECYPAVKAMSEGFSQYMREDGLLENVAHTWNLVDWPEGMRDGYDFPLTRPVVGEGCHNVINALWYGANRMRETMEGLLDSPVSGWSAQIAAAYQKTFYRPEQRLFADSEKSCHCALHSNLYAAFFGLLPKEAEESYVNLLLTRDRYCGVMPMYFALKGLTRIGRHDILYKLLTRTDEHGWRNMLREGATTCFEAWGKDQKWNTSLCHAWASGPIPLLIEDIAGFCPNPEVPEGHCFDPHIPEKLTDFSLRLPWKGHILKIEKKLGENPKLERMDKYAVS